MTPRTVLRVPLSLRPRAARQRGTVWPCLGVPDLYVSPNNGLTSPKKAKNEALQRFLYSQGCGKPRSYWPLRAWQRPWQRSEAK